MQHPHGLKAIVVFDRFSREEQVVEKLFGASEAHGKNPDKYRLWTKTLADWAPDVTADFEAIGDELAKFAGKADTVGLDGGRFVKLAIHNDTGVGTVELPADFISLVGSLKFAIVASVWNDDPVDVETERWSLSVSRSGNRIFESADIQADLPDDLLAEPGEGEDPLVVDVAHEAMHAGVRLPAELLHDAGRARAGITVRFTSVGEVPK